MQTLACLQHYLYVCVCACWWRGDLCEAVCRSSVCVDERECVICSGVLASSACWQKGISSSAWRCPSDSCSLLFSPLHLFSFSSLFLCRSRCLAPSPLCPLCRQKAGITAPPGKMLCIILYSPFLAAFTATNMMCMLNIIQAGGKKENSQEKKSWLSFFLSSSPLPCLIVCMISNQHLPGYHSLLFGTDWEYLLLTYSKDGEYEKSDAVISQGLLFLWFDDL